MFNDDVQVCHIERKLVVVKGKRYLCDIIRANKEEALVRGENLETGEFTDLIKVNDPINAAFRFADYLREK